MKNIAKILSASLLGLSLFVFFSPNTWADANSDHINKLFDKANSDTDAGNYQSAKDTANQIISIDPNAWQGYFARVGSELGSKNYQNALDDYNKTVSLAPELSSVPSFLVFKSVAEYNLQQIDAAKDDMQKAVDLSKANDKNVYKETTTLLSKMNSGDPIDWQTIESFYMN